MGREKRLTRPELAQALQVENSTIGAYIRLKRIALGNDDRITLSEARAQLRNSKQLRMTALDDQDEEGKEDTLGIVSYHQARTRKEIAEATMAELKLAELDGSLIPVAYVEKLVFDRARHFRDSMTGMCKTVAPMLVSVADIDEIERILEAEVRHNLSSFVKTPIVPNDR